MTPGPGARLAGLKLLVSFALLGTGYHGVSDDDFARIVIAQEFAHAPGLDPSGTSWLPLPFWIAGAAMRAFGTAPAVAVAVGVALGVASVILVHRAALRLTRDAASAFWGAAIAAFLPWSARLGASAVPELPAAACSLYALSTLAPGARAIDRLGGAGLLLCACLARYEPWFLGLGFAGVCLVDAAGAALCGAGPARSARDRALLAASALLALAGPALWSAWNAHAHGSPLHYLDRVAAYKQAIDQGAVFERAVSYVLAAFRAEPELAAALGYVGWRFSRGRRAQAAEELAAFRRPTVLLGALLLLLTIASIRGGAPTHHPERALLALHLCAAIALGHVAVLAWRRGLFGPPRDVVRALAAVGVVTASLRAFLLYKESVAARRSELAIGASVAEVVPAGERVMVEVVDYGFFAVMAGSGRPWDFDESAPILPGRPPERLTFEDLAGRARASGAAWLVARSAEREAPAPLVVRGTWGLYDVRALPAATADD